MNVICLYRPNSEFDTPLNDLNRELMRRSNVQLEMLSVDTVEGDAKAQLYDIVAFPTIIATDTSGTLIHAWPSGQIPLLNEVSYYLNQ